MEQSDRDNYYEANTIKKN